MKINLTDCHGYCRGSCAADMLPFSHHVSGLFESEITSFDCARESENAFNSPPDEREVWTHVLTKLQNGQKSILLIPDNSHLGDYESDVSKLKEIVASIPGCRILTLPELEKALAEELSSESHSAKVDVDNNEEQNASSSVRRSPTTEPSITEGEGPTDKASDTKLDSSDASKSTPKPDNALPLQEDKSYPAKVGGTPSLKTTPAERPEPAQTDSSQQTAEEESDEVKPEDESPKEDHTQPTGSEEAVSASDENETASSEDPKESESPKQDAPKDAPTRQTDSSIKTDARPESPEPGISDEDAKTEVAQDMNVPPSEPATARADETIESTVPTEARSSESTAPTIKAPDSDAQTTAKNEEAAQLNDGITNKVKTGPGPEDSDFKQSGQDNSASGNDDSARTNESKGSEAPTEPTVQGKDGQAFKDVRPDIDIHRECTENFDVRMPPDLKKWAKDQFPKGYIARIVRELLAGYDPHHSLAELEIRKLVAQIAKVGNNINQIAKALNIANLEGDPIVLLVIVNQLETIEESLKALLEAQEKGVTDET